MLPGEWSVQGFISLWYNKNNDNNKIRAPMYQRDHPLVGGEGGLRTCAGYTRYFYYYHQTCLGGCIYNVIEKEPYSSIKLKMGTQNERTCHVSHHMPRVKR